MNTLFKYILPLFAAFFVLSCTSSHEMEVSSSAKYFSILEDSVVVSVSPFDGSCDSLRIDAPMQKVVCMSSTLVAGFAEIGAADIVRGVSGKGFISNIDIRNNPEVIDVGYESAMNFESIVSLDPDVVLAYAVSSVEAPYIQKLRSLGVRVMMVFDNFESHPLARAEYIRLCGAIAGRVEVADSVYESVCMNYNVLAEEKNEPVKVMINAPYGDAWYVPSMGSYMFQLISDAGGELLGAKEGLESSLISLETAYAYSREAEIWLNPGYAKSKDALIAMHPSFSDFCKEGLRVYNNTLRMTPEGGNDFYERGAVRPDVILKDLKSIFDGRETSELEYYTEVK